MGSAPPPEHVAGRGDGQPYVALASDAVSSTESPGEVPHETVVQLDPRIVTQTEPRGREVDRLAARQRLGAMRTHNQLGAGFREFLKGLEL